MKPILGLLRRPATVALAAVAILAAVGTNVAAAQPVTTARPAAITQSSTIPITRAFGVMAGPEWYGSYNDEGHLVFCIIPTNGLSHGQPLKVVSELPGVGTTRSRELEYILGQWGATHNGAQAAAVRLALLKVLGTAAPHASSLPASVRNSANTMFTQAQAYAGPAVIRVGASQVLPGQPGHGSVTVTSSRGHGIPGIAVSLSASNATVPAVVKTGANGLVKFNYTRTNTGAVKIVAHSSSLPATTMIISLPDPGQQRLLGRASPGSGTASTSYQFTQGGPSVDYSCSSACDGKPPVTVRFCQPAGVVAAQYYVLDNGTIVATVPFGRSNKVVCKTTTVNVLDTHKVTFAVDYDINGHLVRQSLPGTLVIDCPPWPTVALSMTCLCTSGTIAISVTSHSTTESRLSWTVTTGGTSKSFTQLIAPGATFNAAASFTLTVPVTVTATGAVLRHDGTTWNSTGTAIITAP